MNPQGSEEKEDKSSTRLRSRLISVKLISLSNETHAIDAFAPGGIRCGHCSYHYNLKNWPKHVRLLLDLSAPMHKQTCLAKSKQEMGVSCRGESGQLNAPDDAFVATANKRTFAFER